MKLEQPVDSQAEVATARLSRTPRESVAVSEPLRTIGVLSLLVFLVRNAFELFVVHGLYAAQQTLIMVFDGVLSAWALAEVALIHRRQPGMPVGRLVLALAVQAAVGLIRAVIAGVAGGSVVSVDAIGRPLDFGIAALFVPMHALVFLIIGKLLIDAFSHAERARADELTGQIRLTTRAEAELRAREQDVLAAHRREQASAARQRRMLKHKLESSLMASAVAHEIKLPLSTILLRTRLALDSGTSTFETLEAVASDAQDVVRTIEKMNVLLRSVQSEHTRVDLTEVVSTCLVESRRHFEHLGITVTESGLDRPCFIDGDDAQLRIAVANVLRNAAEAIEAHVSSAAAPAITVSLRRRKHAAVLAIGDSGPGWSGAERGNAPLASKKPAGSGLGLYVVRTVVRNHGGKIAFRRSSFGGAELRLWFPRDAVRTA
jgi:signal transduction histidine kinase